MFYEFQFQQSNATSPTCSLNDAWKNVLFDSYSNSVHPCFVSFVNLAIPIVFLVPLVYQLTQLLFFNSFGPHKIQYSFGSPFSIKSVGVLSILKYNSVLIQAVLVFILTYYNYDDISNLTTSSLAVNLVTLVALVLPLHIVESTRSVVGSASLLWFWFINTFTTAVILAQDAFSSHKIYIPVASKEIQSLIHAVEILTFLNSVIVLFLESKFYTPSIELTEYFDLNEWDTSRVRDVFSRFSFVYLKDAITLARKTNNIGVSDLPPTSIELDNEVAYFQFSKYWSQSVFRANQKTEKRKLKAKGKPIKDSRPSLFIPVLQCTYPFLLRAIFFDITDIFINLSQPYLLKAFLTFISKRVSPEILESQKPPILYGFIIATTIYIMSVVRYIGFNRYFVNGNSLGYTVETFLASHVYNKSLKLSPKARKAKTSGEIVNNLAQDVQTLTDSPEIIMNGITQPMRFTIYLVSLYSFLGSASIAGLATALVLIPFASSLIVFVLKQIKLQMKYKDERAKLTSEILNSIKSIKLYSWETPMLKRLDVVRNKKELEAIKRMGIWNSFIEFIWNSIPFFVSCASFAASALWSKILLTPEVIFPALALFDLLTEPILVLPNVFSQIAETKVAIGRLVDLFTMEELENSGYERSFTPVKADEQSVDIKNATFVWTKEPLEDQSKPADEEVPKPSDEEANIESTESTTVNPVALKNIDFSARRGQLNCVVGKVGSGKSTLLKAILGNIPVDPERSTDFKVKVTGSIAYCAQNAWIMNSTVRENILFGRRYNKAFYEATIEACELTKDFEMLPDGDRTAVGEKGISLSGGQKARLSLARAVYSKAEVYILDDILSAVDAHVGKNIIKKVLSKNGLLASKTVILATNSVTVLHEAHNIVLLESGEITERGNFEEVMSRNGQLATLINEFGKKEEEIVEEEEKVIDGTELVVEQHESSSDEEPKVFIPESVGHELTKVTTRASVAASFVSFGHSYEGDFDDDPETSKKTGEQDEIQKRGQINLSVYIEFFKACNYSYIFIYVVLVVATIATSMLNNYLLKYWSEWNSKENENVRVVFFLVAYAGIGISGCVFTLIGAFVMWVYCAVNGGRYFHDKMARAVLRSPMSFFETTPIGRILNRFSEDISVIDQHLVWVFVAFVSTLARGFGVFAVVVYNLPVMFFAIIIMLFFYDLFRKDFIPASRELKRLRSAKKSPVFSHLQESISGIDTIAAFNQTDRFIHKHQSNMNQLVLVEYSNLGCNRWLSMRLQSLSSIIVYASTLMILVSVRTSSSLSPGLVGFIMTYVLEVTGVLNAVVRYYAEIETRAVTVERLIEYCNLTPEADMIIEDKRPEENWPQQGKIEFKNYTTKYRENLDPVLKEVNFVVNPTEKIGIVGRTGAGKSTLTLALFRILEATDGHIEIDGVNTSEIGLFDLRSKLNIIPQDSQILDGTIRQNLDPFENYTDEQLWKVLEMSHLKEHIASMKTEVIEDDDEDSGKKSPDAKPEVTTGLNALVTEGGSNLSAGQRQLMCLARALLNPSKVLILDEATASVDVETDKIVQETIRSEFKDKTILTIAHRIDTIMDSDKILVLDKGSVKEFAPPRDLLKDKSTIFYSLCKQSGHLPAEFA